jgi:hypothetical protein
MAATVRIIIDDRLLIEELLVSLPSATGVGSLHTTSYWYYRACRAAVVGAGGYLSGPFERLERTHQERAIMTLLDLRDDIGLPDPRVVVPIMAEVATRHPRLNLLNLEAVATARVLSATVWLSEPAAGGVLPSVLDAEHIEWVTISID